MNTTVARTLLGFFLVLTMLTLAAALPALAEDAHHPEKKDAPAPAAKGMGPMGGAGAPYASLSPEKLAAVAAIDQAFTAKMNDIRQRMWAKNAEIEAVLAQPKADRKKAMALSKDLAGLQAEMHEAMIERRLKIAEETGITMPMGRGGMMMGPGMGGMMEMMGGGMMGGMMGGGMMGGMMGGGMMGGMMGGMGQPQAQ